MAHILADLKESFKRGNICIQFIFINVGIFILTKLSLSILTLFKRSGEPILLYGELPASLNNLISQPWSIVTYMFMHIEFMHILFNMLWLYWFGQLFLYFFSAKHLRGLYVLGGIFGAALYILLFNLFPYFDTAVEKSYMLGASASVLAIVMATAYRKPDYEIKMLFLGTIRLKYIALFMVVSDLIFLSSENAGGHIAHLGGAFAGWMFAASLTKGHDITAWINTILDWIISIFNGKLFKRENKPKMKVQYTKKQKDYDYNAQKKAQSNEIDRILDKLKKSGYENLSTEEKKSLFDASKK